MDLKATQKLQGHSDAVLTCCFAQDGHTVYTGGEDGQLCCFDLRTGQQCGNAHLSKEAAVPSICVHPEQHNVLYAAAGASVTQLDCRKFSSPVCTWAVDTEEVNCVAVQADGGQHMAMALDEGDVLVVKLPLPASVTQAESSSPQLKHVRHIRNAHSNIASAVAFRPAHAWELYSAGLDCRLACWEFSRGRLWREWSCSTQEQSSETRSQMYNPPMVHSIAVPPQQDANHKRLVAIGRGDGIVEIHDTSQTQKKARPASTRNTSNSSSKRAGRRKGVPTHSKPCTAEDAVEHTVQQVADAVNKLSVDATAVPTSWQFEAHASAVNHVCFIGSTQPGCAQLLSGGNDGVVALWNWSADSPAVLGGSGETSSDSADIADVHKHAHGKKVNCVVGLLDGATLTCAVADVTRTLTLYQTDQ